MSNKKALKTIRNTAVMENYGNSVGFIPVGAFADENMENSIYFSDDCGLNDNCCLLKKTNPKKKLNLHKIIESDIFEENPFFCKGTGRSNSSSPKSIGYPEEPLLFPEYDTLCLHSNQDQFDLSDFASDGNAFEFRGDFVFGDWTEKLNSH